MIGAHRAPPAESRECCRLRPSHEPPPLAGRGPGPGDVLVERRPDAPLRNAWSGLPPDPGIFNRA